MTILKLADTIISTIQMYQIYYNMIQLYCQGVGRASFYRNFENKEDILRAYINQLFHGWIEGYVSNIL